jgi:hypothetical protein
MKSCMHPPIRLTKMAYVASPAIGDWARVAVSSDMMATGPIVTSLDEPNNV